MSAVSVVLDYTQQTLRVRRDHETSKVLYDFQKGNAALTKWHNEDMVVQKKAQSTSENFVMPKKPY